MKKRMLFVDDETDILEVLRYMLRNMLPEWNTSFAKSGQEALDLMTQSTFDVIVFDALLPGRDGAELLNKVNKEFPHVVRLSFSCDNGGEKVDRLISTTHTFLLKPDDLSQIKNTIDRAFTLRDLLSKDSLKNVISQIKTLPSLPEMYCQIVAELRSPYPSVERVGKIVSQDMAMSAKLLQIVNSAFFGLRQHISDTTQAASLLGLDILKSLVLVMRIFTEQRDMVVRRFSLKALWAHSLAVAVLSQDLALQQDMEKKATDDAFIAGLLHDLGKLVLMVNMRQHYSHVLTMVQEKRLPLVVMEKDELGANHGEVGAYLLGLWCFSEPLIQACAFHHEPGLCRDQRFGPLTTVHVANRWNHEAYPDEICGELTRLDMDYLRRLGLAERMPTWRVHLRL